MYLKAYKNVWIKNIKIFLMEFAVYDNENVQTIEYKWLSIWH